VTRRSFARRLSAVLLAGTGSVLVLASGASAHAVLSSSDPAAGERLSRAPDRVTLRFTETPEPTLSSIQVLDTSGGDHVVGELRADGLELIARVEPVDQGVYTVAWRVVSAVDGHATVGSFAFGVGVTPTTQPEDGGGGPVATQEGLHPLEAVGRGLFLAGLVGLLGAALGGWWVARDLGTGSRAVPLVGLPSAVVALVGLVLLGMAQKEAAAAPLSTLLTTSLGRALLYRAGGLVIATWGVVVATRPGTRRIGSIAMAVGAALAALAHVAAGHAGASAPAFLEITAQWAHVVAGGLWVGGLLVLLLAVRGAASEEKAGAAKRFSTVAGLALVVVGLTGVLRAIPEVGSWSALFSTGYGIGVVVKAAAFMGLGVLGATNRFRNVRAAATSLRGLRLAGAGELVFGVVAVGTAAAIASIVPSASQPEPVEPVKPPPPVEVSGSDFATSIRLTLVVDPGLPGENTFTATVEDYDTEEPVDAELVRLTFRSLGPAGFEGTLDLEPGSDPGTYTAAGTNVSVAGPWEVTAVVQQASDSRDVVLTFATRCDAEGTPVEGQPTIYVDEIGGGRTVQGYVEPGAPGSYEVHATFFDQAGNELPVGDDASFAAFQPGSGEPVPLEIRKLSPGHLVATAALEPGEWRFDVDATAPNGDALHGCFEQTIEEG
jgi:copper transport protein